MVNQFDANWGLPLLLCNFFPTAKTLHPRDVERGNGRKARQAAVTVDSQVKEVLSTGQSLYTVDEALLEELRPDVILTQDLCQVCSIDLQARTLRSDLFSNILVNYVLPPYF